MSCYRIILDFILNYSLQDDYKYIEKNKIVNGWNMERGFEPEDKFDEFPYRVLGAGDNTGLKLVLAVNKSDMDFICRGPLQGFKVM